MTGESARHGTDGDVADSPSDAFQLVGNEIRTALLQTVAAEGPCRFATLAAKSDVETTAGVAYHLRQLDGQFLRQREDDRYELTAPGRKIVRAMDAGQFTTAVEVDSIELEESCPYCSEPELVMEISDGIARVRCEGCTASILALSAPSGSGRVDDQSVAETVDEFHRHRIESFAAGRCPDCAGPVESTVERVTDGEPPTPQASFTCTNCGSSLECPLTHTVLDHPAVVSLYHDHGASIRDRPLWNVGDEWRERCLSTEPWCLLVSTRLGDEVLDLYLGADCTVVTHERRTLADTERSTGQSGDDVTA